jgi:hypothetical protein
MEMDFALDQGNAVIRNGLLYDLHNFYDFAGAAIDGKKLVTMSFVPNRVHGSGAVPLTIEFSEIDVFELSPGFAVEDVTDIDEMGFKNPNDQDLDWLLDQRQATPTDHLVFRFAGGHFLRVHARIATLKVLGAG